MKPLLTALRTPGIKALAHITGGGFTENVPRVLPATCTAEINLAAVNVPPVFGWLARAGGVAEAEMLRTFNCGIGMIVVVDVTESERVMEVLTAAGERPIVVGRIVPPASARVTYIGQLAL